MKILKRIFLFLIVFLVLGGIAGYMYIMNAFPKVEDAPNLKITATPEMLKRGQYLFNTVCDCADCHSTRDYSKYAGPLVEGTLGQGGFEFNEELGLPGKFYAKNITPASLTDWTDGEIFRAITEGVDKEGNPLFPLMPYLNFGKMDKDDIYSIIAYIRTLKPIENNVPASRPNFPMNLIMRTIPARNDLQPIPDKRNSIEYGKYLVSSAGCNDCHTQQVKGEYKKDMYLAGGQEYNMPGNYIIRASNITPDNESGIGLWTKDIFIKKFKSFSKTEFKPVNIKEGEFNTFMPWTFFGNMTEEDLGAIFDYLRTVNPVYNKVEKFSKVTY